jgi:hypothetical protein
MGAVYCIGDCFGCGRLFQFNPLRVPSVRIEGKREPICQICVAYVNPMRVARGLPPIVPLPNAYGPCDESELEND